VIYECEIKNPDKIKEYWTDRVKAATKELGFSLPKNFGELTVKQLEGYTKSLWDILGVEIERGEK